MAWFCLFFAGLLEIVWAYYMKQSLGFTKLIPSLITIVTMVFSFLLLSLSMRTLPLSTAYVIWTGVGAVGTFLLGILFLAEPVNLAKITAGLLIISGLIIMKFSS